MQERHLMSLTGLLLSMDDCLEKRQIMPCLILLYSGLEIVARMGSKPREATRLYFMRWVEHYVLSADELDVSSLDLYAARCGVIHAFSPESDLFRDGRARRIAYSWGDASVETLRASIATTSHDIAALDLNQFVQAFKVGIANFLEDLERDPAARERADEVGQEWFSELSMETMDTFLNVRAES